MIGDKKSLKIPKG